MYDKNGNPLVLFQRVNSEGEYTGLFVCPADKQEDFEDAYADAEKKANEAEEDVEDHLPGWIERVFAEEFVAD